MMESRDGAKAANNAVEYGGLLELFVRPFYSKLLNGNFLREDPDAESFLPAHLALAVQAITDGQLRRLFRDENWRTRLTAAWFAGMDGRMRFAAPIARRLAASNGNYADQGYCMALGLLGSGECRQALVRYLEANLPCQDHSGHQKWAVGAIAHIDGRMPPEFMVPDLWRSADGETNQVETGSRLFRDVVGYLRTHAIGQFGQTANPSTTTLDPARE